MNGTEEVTSRRATARRKKSGRKKSVRKRKSIATRKISAVHSTKKPLYTCPRHGYHTNPSASKESQMHGKAMHLGRQHGGRGTHKHGGRGRAKGPTKITTNSEPRVMRTKAHNRVGGRGTTVSTARLENLTTNWLQTAADAPGPVSAALVRCINDINHVLGK